MAKVLGPRMAEHMNLLDNVLTRRDTEDAFSVTISNTGAATATVSLFDHLRACTTSANQAETDEFITTSYPGGIAKLREYISRHNISIKGIQYKPKAQTQFAQAFAYVIGNTAGEDHPTNLKNKILLAENSGQANPDVRYINFKGLLQGSTDVVINVMAAEVVTLVFEIIEIERAL